LKKLSILIAIFVLTCIRCYGDMGDMGTLKGKVIYPGGDPQGIVVLFFFDDPKMDYMIKGIVIQSQDGSFEVALPPGKYYIQAQIDVNRNGQTDAGDLLYTYGGDKPVAVSPGTDVVFPLGTQGINPLNSSGLPSDGKDSSDNNPGGTGKKGTLKGKAIIPGHSSTGVVIVMFKDPTFETLVTASKVTSSDGTFNITVPEGTYYIQAFYDANGNGQIDQGDTSVIYGGEEPESVKCGEDITIIFKEQGSIADGNPVQETPSPSPAPTAISTPAPVPTATAKIKGNLRVKIVYPDHSPAGCIVQAASDQQFNNILATTAVWEENGSAGFSLPEGKYYIRSFSDDNGNKKVDPREYYSIYEKGKPRQVSTGGGEIVLVLDEMKDKIDMPDIISARATPSPGNNISLPHDISMKTPVPESTKNIILPDDISGKNKTPVPGKTPVSDKGEKKVMLKGKVVYNDNDPTGIKIFVFSDMNFKNFITTGHVKDESGLFEIELPDRDYYIQAFVDINKNQILDPDDILANYTATDTPVLKSARPGVEEIIIKVTPKKQPGDNSALSTPKTPSSGEHEYTVTGRVIWKDHALSKGIVEAYSDATFRTVKARGTIDKPGGEFILKLPEGKYFLTVVIDDNLDNNIGLGDGVGIYGMEAIAESRGEAMPIVVNSDDEHVEIAVTDFLNLSGQLVSLEKYTPGKTAEPKSEISEYGSKIKSFQEIRTGLNLSGKIYFSREGEICMLNLSNGTSAVLSHGYNPTVSLSGDKIAYMSPSGEIILSSTDGTKREIIKQGSLCQSMSLSSTGAYLAYQEGKEVTVLDLMNKKEYKKIFTADTGCSPFGVSWFTGDEKIVYLRGAGRKDILKTDEEIKEEKKQPGSPLPFDGLKLDGQNSGKIKNQSATDGLFPIIMSRSAEQEDRGAGVYIWDKSTQDSYYMDLKEAGSISNVLWSQANPNLFLFTTGIPSQIWIGKMASNGFEKKQLTLYGGQSPNWAPDGKHVIYVNNKQIWIVNIDTGEEIPLLNGVLPVYGDNPCWSY